MLELLARQLREKEKTAHDLEAKAAKVDVAVFDLKAENPNRVTKVDERTPRQIIANMEAHGRIVGQALQRLNELMEVNQ